MARAIPVGALGLLLALLVSGCASPGATKGGVEGTAMVGPTCPVERNPPDPACADRPYTGMLVLLASTDQHIVRTFQPAANGSFAVEAPAGTYTIRSPDSPDGPRLPTCASQEPIVVQDGRWTHVAVECDSGIR